MGAVNLVELGNDPGYIAACHYGADYKIEYSESIDTHIASSTIPMSHRRPMNTIPRSSTGSIWLTSSHYQIIVIQTLPFNNPTKEGVMTIP
ncbi:hypothetical protein Bca52824_095297 [Brassica carinata]|uniref:Uncharacterized protein n=1 Tax=Brassica carinata TaxID=52824 RepID=A0A8X7P3Q3_BRACI|nr:hypothetical protein Bca52824_095297 [Brassica carinata]